MISRHIEQVYAGICHVQVLGTGKVAVDSYTLGPENVVIKLFSDTKQEKMAEPPLSSLKGTRGGHFKALFRPFK